MSIRFARMRDCEGKRVNMRFDDGFECIATLSSAQQDMDGSLHLIYDHVESCSDPRHFSLTNGSSMYAPGESLVSIEEIDRPAEKL